MTLTAVVLAAGRSARMGRENKLLADLAGRPVLAHILALAAAPPFTDALVVTGHEREAIAALADAAGVRAVHNTEWRDGMGASLRAGAAALPPEADGFAVLLGDVPLVRSATLAALARAWSAAPPPAIVRPTYRGQPGHPVFFDRAFAPDLLRLSGDAGAHHVIRAHADRLVLIETDDEGVTLDVDTPEALRLLRARVGRSAGRE